MLKVEIGMLYSWLSSWLACLCCLFCGRNGDEKMSCVSFRSPGDTGGRYCCHRLLLPHLQVLFFQFRLCSRAPVISPHCAPGFTGAFKPSLQLSRGSRPSHGHGYGRWGGASCNPSTESTGQDKAMLKGDVACIPVILRLDLIKVGVVRLSTARNEELWKVAVSTAWTGKCYMQVT